MRWTQENEQILWKTIFETQSFHIDLDKLSKAWPGEDKPSPKALEGQLSKYRKNLKGDNTITFSLGSKRSANSESGPPRKRRATKKAVAQAEDIAKETSNNAEDF
ncbi:hypothetical protein AWENTII_002072 [Aspergillus wentii]